MRTSMVFAAVTVLLGACATPQERTAFRENPVQALAPIYGPACDKRGYAKDTEQWRNCILRSSTRDELAQYSLFYDRYAQWYWLR